ncbi:MAG: nucleotidyltransferase domain-containing protein [Chloroflexota bacterium]
MRVVYPRFSRDELIERLRRDIPILFEVLPLERVVLFGSWASGRATAFSDIDLLVVYAGRPREDAYKTVRQCLLLRGLEAHVYAAEEAAQLDDTLDRMTRHGIELL